MSGRKTMRRLKQVIGLTSAALLMSGCSQLNSELGTINEGLSQVSGVSATPVVAQRSTGKPIQTAWHVTDGQALRWLSHDQTIWDDGGKLKQVNWYTFWKQQIDAKTSLASAGYKACHNNPNSGANCQSYLQAYSMSKSQESQYWGNQLIEDNA